MSKMLLLFALIWSCFATVNSIPDMATTSLIQMARSDPMAFAALFQGAPKEKVTKIIELLEVLIGTAERDIKNITDSLDKAEKDLSTTNEALTKKIPECVQLAKVLKRSQEKVVIAKGVLKEYEDALEDDETNLLDEISTLKGVVETLGSLTTPKELISTSRFLLSSLQRTDLSLSSLEKIDPDALQPVIEMLDGLIKDAEASLQDLKNNVSKASSALGDAEEASSQADTQSTLCDKEEAQLRTEVDTAEGIKEAAQDIYDDRFQVLTKEVNTLRSVIDILQGLL